MDRRAGSCGCGAGRTAAGAPLSARYWSGLRAVFGVFEGTGWGMMACGKERRASSFDGTVNGTRWLGSHAVRAEMRGRGSLRLAPGWVAVVVHGGTEDSFVGSAGGQWESERMRDKEQNRVRGTI